MSQERTSTVTAPDGRTLFVRESGVPDGAVIVSHHGTPGAGRHHPRAAATAERLGVRLIGYDRPGYGGSTPQPGRSIADCAADVATILDALGVDRFATYGISGGGPHSLACAALLGDRCAAAATIAGVGPSDADDLDFLAGMGEGNHAEFGAAAEGHSSLTTYCEQDAAALREVGPEQLADAMRPHLSDVDAAILTGELAAFLIDNMHIALEPGVEGWVEDDLAFLAPWGFDVGAIGIPTLIWQGEEDLMVPGDHGRWLGERVSGAEAEVVPGEGHLTLAINRMADVQGWLLERLTP